MPPFSKFFRRKRTLFVFALTIVIAFITTRIPLFNVLGFEFSFLMAIVGSLASAYLGSQIVHLAHQEQESLVFATMPAKKILSILLLRAILTAWLILILPLIIIWTNAIWVKNCDIWSGLYFYFALAGLSVVFAAVAGVIAALIAGRRLGGLLAILIIIFSLAWGVYRFYRAPAIFGYDPFAGYFPGSLYDEDIKLFAAFYYSRLYQLSWALFFIFVAALFFDPTTFRLSLRGLQINATKAHLVAIGLMLTIAILLSSLSGKLGFNINQNDLITALGGVAHTKHFDIYYPKDLPQKEVERLKEDHEFRYHQLFSTFKKNPGKIRSYLFRSGEEQRALMGAASVFIAKPWRKEVYLRLRVFPHRVLKHELAHVFAGLYGDPLFAISLDFPKFNVGLIEGIAVALDWRPVLGLTGHQRAVALTKLKLAPPIDDLFGLKFLAHAGPRSYAMAGSFCRFLLDTKGFDKLARVYQNGGDFQSVYKNSLSALILEWKNFISKVKLSDEELKLAKSLYQRGSIFKRVCPHVIANTLNKVQKDIDAKDYTRALDLYQHLCSLEPQNIDRKIGKLGIMRYTKPIDVLLKDIEKVLATPKMKERQKRKLFAIEGDFLFLAKRYDDAKTAYQRAANIRGLAGERRMIRIKKWALDQSEAIRDFTLNYLVANPKDKPSQTRSLYTLIQLSKHTKNGIGPYLLGKYLLNRDERDIAIKHFEDALQRGLDDPDILAEARLSLGKAYYLNGNYRSALTPFDDLAKNPPSKALELVAQDWIARINWRLSGKLSM